MGKDSASKAAYEAGLTRPSKLDGKQFGVSTELAHPSIIWGQKSQLLKMLP